MALKIKKVIIDEKGNSVEIEGTPEEVAEYERSLEKNKGKSEGATKRKQLLKDEVKRLVGEELEEYKKFIDNQPKQEQHHHHYWPGVIPQQPQWCPYCGTYGCSKPHVWITYGSDSTQLTFKPDNTVRPNQWISNSPNINIGGSSTFVSKTLFKV